MCADVMTNDTDYICRNQLTESTVVEDDDLDEILQLADSIRAHPLHDKPLDDCDIDLLLLDIQSSALAADMTAGNFFAES